MVLVLYLLVLVMLGQMRHLNHHWPVPCQLALVQALSAQTGLRWLDSILSTYLGRASTVLGMFSICLWSGVLAIFVHNLFVFLFLSVVAFPFLLLL